MCDENIGMCFCNGTRGRDAAEPLATFGEIIRSEPEELQGLILGRNPEAANVQTQDFLSSESIRPQGTFISG